MRLALVLLRTNKNSVNGHLFRGKYRRVKPVLEEDVQKLKNQFEIEEKNMFYLRHPYLTTEESHGHAKALGIPDMRFQEKMHQQRMKFKESVTLEDRLGHLRYKEAWE